MNGPIVYAWILSPEFEHYGACYPKARFTWTGSAWRLSLISCFDGKGRFMRSFPGSDYTATTRRQLSEGAFDVYGPPYSEKWQEQMKHAGLPIIRLQPRPTR